MQHATAEDNPDILVIVRTPAHPSLSGVRIPLLNLLKLKHHSVTVPPH
jgi:hypothetical protein